MNECMVFILFFSYTLSWILCFIMIFLSLSLSLSLSLPTFFPKGISSTCVGTHTQIHPRTHTLTHVHAHKYTRLTKGERERGTQKTSIYYKAERWKDHSAEYPLYTRGVVPEFEYDTNAICSCVMHEMRLDLTGTILSTFSTSFSSSVVAGPRKKERKLEWEYNVEKIREFQEPRG